MIRFGLLVVVEVSDGIIWVSLLVFVFMLGMSVWKGYRDVTHSSPGPRQRRTPTRHSRGGRLSRRRRVPANRFGDEFSTRFGVSGVPSETFDRRSSCIIRKRTAEDDIEREANSRDDWVISQFYGGMCTEELDNLSDYSV